MKKLSVVCVILAVLLCFAACNPTSEPTNPNDGQKTVYEVLNALKNVDYDKILLEVTTSANGDVLNSRYLFTKTDDGVTVEFSYQELALYDVDNPQEIERVQTHSGFCTVKDGVVTSSEGDEINISVKGTGLGGLNFAENNFVGANFADGKFESKVANGKAFCGIVGEDMSVVVSYGTNAIKSVVIRYGDGGSDVAVSYTVL